MKSKNLLALAVMATLFSYQSAEATFFLCRGGEKKTLEETTAEAKKKKWTKTLMDQLKGAQLKYSLNILSANLSKAAFNFDVDRSSEQTIAGKYSQADHWQLGVGTDLFNTDPNGRLGLYGHITYVRQFDTREESICDDIPWYDPRDMVPQSSADFDLTRKHSLKPGQFIEFKTELVLGIPSWFSQGFNIMSPLSIQGNFKIQIFRMSENLVRVRVSVTQDKAGRVGARYSILGLPGGLGKQTQIEFTLIEALKARLDVVDTVFNLDPTLNANKKAQGLITAHELYDTLIGSKTQLELKNWFKLGIEAFKINLPEYNKYREKIMKELEALPAASLTDAKQVDGSYVFSDSGRRVYLLSQANAKGVKKSANFGAQFLRLFQVRWHNYDYESLMSVTESDHIKSNFLVSGMGRLAEWKVLKLFGKSFNVATNLVFRAPETINPLDYETGNNIESAASHGGEQYPTTTAVKLRKELELTSIYGFQLIRDLKDQEFDARESQQLKNMLKDQLTDRIFEKIKWRLAEHAELDEEKTENEKLTDIDPQWDAFTSRSQSNVELNQDIIFKESIFKRYNSGSQISENSIAASIKDILIKKANNNEELKAIPFVVKQQYGMTSEGGAVEAPELRLKNQRKYISAYAQDIQIISGYLAAILNSNNTRDRYSNYKNLLTNELFMEIGGIILMYVNMNTLNEDVAVKLVLGTQARKVIVGYYPSKKAYDSQKVFSAVVDYQNQLTDRSYNLRNFIDESGNPISLKQLLINSSNLDLGTDHRVPKTGSN